MKYLATKLTLCVSLAAFIGCGDTSTESASETPANSHTEHGENAHHDEEPADFSETLQNVETMKITICKAFADGTPENAHDLLHDVGHSLEKLPELAAKKSELTSDQLSKVNSAVEELFDGFGQLDDTMHGGEEVDIDELDKRLTKALSDLKEAVK